MLDPVQTYNVTKERADQAGVLARSVWRSCQDEATQDTDDFTERFDWFYLDNPAGKPSIYFLWAGESRDAVGLQSVAPRTFLIRGRAHTFGLLFDFIVARKHRTVFPAMQLLRQSLADALPSGAAYGLPSEKAVPIVLRLRPQATLLMARFARVLRFGAYFERSLPYRLAVVLGGFVDLIDRVHGAVRLATARCTLQWKSEADADLDSIWQQLARTNLVIGLRDRAFIQWRFFTHRPGRYRLLLVSDRGGAPHTYFVCETAEGLFIVKDLLSCGTRKQLRNALRALIESARQEGALSISISLVPNAATQAALQHVGFRIREERQCFMFLPQSLSIAQDGAEWYMTPADEDV